MYELDRNRQFGAMPTDMYETGDPVPQGVVHDNNRGSLHAPQMKGKIFQSIDEIYNNPVKSHNGAVYNCGEYSDGTPINRDPVVNAGPFNR